MTFRPSGSERSDELLSVGEVAALLRVHPMTVMAWARQGKLPAVKVGRAWRVRWRDLDAWYAVKLGEER